MNRLVLQFTATLHLQRYSSNSVQNHRLDILKFVDWLGQRAGFSEADLNALGPVAIREYQKFLAERLKERSINRHLSSLRLFFRFLLDSGLVQTNPMDQISYHRFPSALPAMLMPNEVNALLAAPDQTHYLGLRDQALLELLYSTGLKLNELIGLNVDSLELELAFVRVQGSRERMVPLTGKCISLLRRYLEECRPGRVLHKGEPCLFPGRNRTRISRVGVWKLVKKYAERAGINKTFNPRTLRHAFAIHLLLGGADLDTIRFLFGYRKLEATSLYTHVNAPDFQAAYRAYHPFSNPPGAPFDSPPRSKMKVTARAIEGL